MKTIPLTQNKIALVSDEDFEELSKYKWHLHTTKFGDYARTSNPKRYMHTFLMNPGHGYEVDHQDGDGLNNQRSNMRICTSSQNKANQKVRSDNVSGFKGVSWDKSREKWLAQTHYKGKYKYIGRFANKLEAVNAYNTTVIELFGDFAKVNRV